MLKGTLDDFTLADVFRLMSLARRTGKLEVVRSAGHGKVFVREGEVYYAESSLAREPLGQKLIRAGALTEGALMKALDENAAGGKRVGEILVDNGAISYEQLQQALRQQIEDAVFDLLRWDLGDFTWEPGVLAEVEVNIAVSVENLIIEASRRLDELEVIGRKIPSIQSILRMAQTPPEGAHEINITPEEWRMLVLVDGNRSVHDIALQVGVDDFTALRSLYGLVSAGLVEVEEGRDSIDAAGKPGEAVAGFSRSEEPAEAAIAEAAEAIVASGEAEAEPVEEPEEAEEPALAAEEFEGEAAAAFEATDHEATVTVVGTDPELEGPAEPEEATATVVGTDPELEASVFAAAAGEDDFFHAEDVSGEADEAPSTDDVEAPEAPEELEATEEPEPDVGSFDEPAPEELTTTVPDDDSDPFLNDLLGSSSPTGSVAPEPPPPAPPSPEQPEPSPSVDRAAAVRELAGLFDDDRPRERTVTPKKKAEGSEAKPGEDERRRVEDDDAINKGLIGRLIDGVKGL